VETLSNATTRNRKAKIINPVTAATDQEGNINPLTIVINSVITPRRQSRDRALTYKSLALA